MRGDSGVTLLELLVVLALLGLVSGLAATAYGGRTERLADRLSADVQSLLRSARREAIDSGRVVHVELAAHAISTQPSRAPTVLRSRQDLHARWRSADGRHGAPAFYPDGSAAPGAVELDIADRHLRIEIDWYGGMRDRALQR